MSLFPSSFLILSITSIVRKTLLVQQACSSANKSTFEEWALNNNTKSQGNSFLSSVCLSVLSHPFVSLISWRERQRHTLAGQRRIAVFLSFLSQFFAASADAFSLRFLSYFSLVYRILSVMRKAKPKMRQKWLNTFENGLIWLRNEVMMSSTLPHNLVSFIVSCCTPSFSRAYITITNWPLSLIISCPYLSPSHRVQSISI